MNINLKYENPDGPKLNIHEKDGVVFLSNPLLDQFDWVVNGISTRIGGVSEGEVSTLNLSMYIDEAPEKTTENYRRLMTAMGLDYKKTVSGRQSHEDHVVVIDENHVFPEVPGIQADYDNTDGFVTNLPGAVLTVRTADCVPISIVDPVHKAVGVCHSGWKGTVKKISQATLRKMKEAYGTDPADVYVGIGPSICMDCFEVQWDLIEAFKAAFDEETLKTLYYQKDEIKYRFDLWQANKLILLEAGVKEDHIAQANLCTMNNADVLYSYRALRPACPSMATVISIVE
ncbi:MAG: peptidoglycan editing factor PgeF [Parasporobacterium sp.]|nr:peptidoglycan editing factor PgeF [Parasporobacterium sp.]